EPRIVAVGTTTAVIGVRPSQRIVRVDGEAMSHALAEGEVRAVVVRPVNRLVVAYAAQFWLARRLKRCIERTRAADSAHWNFLVDVDGLVFMKAENVRVLHLNRRIRIQRPAITAIEFLTHRIAIVGVHQTTDAARIELGGGSG